MVRPTRRVLYVEGGGDRNPSLASECRRAFSKLFEKAGIQRRPKVVACGGRQSAYDRFCTAHQSAEDGALSAKKKQQEGGERRRVSRGQTDIRRIRVTIG